MPTFKSIAPEVRAEVINQVRNGGVSVTAAAAKHGISNKTIYNWLRSEVVNSERSLILELNRLKKENEQLYGLLGRATAELKRPKG